MRLPLVVHSDHLTSCQSAVCPAEQTAARVAGTPPTPQTAPADAEAAEQGHTGSRREGEGGSKPANEEPRGEEDVQGSDAVEVSYAQLSAMCDGFARWRMVGVGTTGTVYRGNSKELGDVAVKALNSEMSEGWDLWLVSG